MRGLKHTIREGIISLCLRGRQRSSLSRILPIKQIFCRAGIYRRANFDCKLCKYNDDEKTICSEDCSDALIDGLIEIKLMSEETFSTIKNYYRRINNE